MLYGFIFYSNLRFSCQKDIIVEVRAQMIQFLILLLPPFLRFLHHYIIVVYISKALTAAWGWELNRQRSFNSRQINRIVKKHIEYLPWADWWRNNIGNSLRIILLWGLTLTFISQFHFWEFKVRKFFTLVETQFRHNNFVIVLFRDLFLWRLEHVCETLWVFAISLMIQRFIIAGV